MMTRERSEMMHSILAACVTALVTSIPLLAQEEEDVLHLKDGSTVRGDIIEHLPGESLKIKTKGGVLVYPVGDIARVARAPSSGDEVRPQAGLSMGDRVRVTLGVDQMTGTVASMTQSGLVLDRSHGGPLSVMYGEVGRLERSLGIRTHQGRGAATGFLIGAPTGALIGLWGANFCLMSCPDPSTAEQLRAMAEGALLLGAPCGLLGMVIGALVKREEWEPVPIPSTTGRWRISPTMDVASIGGDRRAVLGVRVRF